MLEKQAALHLCARILSSQSHYWVVPRANGLGTQVPINPALWARQSASDMQLVDSSARRQGAAEAVKDENLFWLARKLVLGISLALVPRPGDLGEESTDHRPEPA